MVVDGAAKLTHLDLITAVTLPEDSPLLCSAVFADRDEKKNDIWLCTVRARPVLWNVSLIWLSEGWMLDAERGAMGGGEPRRRGRK